MNVSGYPTATEVMTGKGRLRNMGTFPPGSVLDRLSRRVSARVDRALSTKLLRQLYSEPSFALRSGFSPDDTRVAFSSDGWEHGIQLMTDGRPPAKILWDFSSLNADRSLLTPYEYKFRLRIGEGEILKDLDLAELRKALDRPLVKPVGRAAEDVDRWERMFTMTRSDYLTWLAVGGASIGMGALTGSALTMFVGAGAASIYTLFSKIRDGAPSAPTTPTVGLSDPMTLYRLMSADLESAQRYSDLAQRDAQLRSAFRKTIDVEDIDAMTALDRTIPRLVESCLATIETLQSTEDRRSVLVETASAIDDTLHVAETRLAARDKDAIAGHRDVLAGARMKRADQDAPQVLH